MELDNFSIGGNYIIIIVIIMVVLSVGILIYDTVAGDSHFCKTQGGRITIPNSTCDWGNSIRNECETVKCQLINGSVIELF